MSSKKQAYTVHFEIKGRIESTEVQSNNVSDAIALAVENTGFDRQNIFKVEFPDDDYPGETNHLSGSVLHFWL